MKVVISDPKTGKAYQKELDESLASMFYGKKIGEIVDLSPIGLNGYKAEIRGGTDKDGFPMRADVHGMGRKKILIKGGPGNRSGVPRRKTVRGNVVGPDIAQLNLKIIEWGEKSLEEIFSQAGGN